MVTTRPIPAFPDYGITQTGDVYRVTPYPAPSRARFGPTPRKLAVVWCGNSKSGKRWASVTLTRPGRMAQKRSIAKLMAGVWPEVEFEPMVREIAP